MRLGMGLRMDLEAPGHPRRVAWPMTECCGADSPPPATCPLQTGCFWGISSRDKEAQTQPTPPGAPSAPARCAVGTGGAGFAPFAFFFVCVCPSRAFARGSASLFIAGWCLWVVFFFFFPLPLFSCLCLCRHRGRIAVISYHGEYYSRRSTSPPCHPRPLVLSCLGKASSQPGGGWLRDTHPGTPLLPPPPP